MQAELCRRERGWAYQIDNLITTHWHGDHFGGMAELAGRIPIQKFIDHGPNVQPNATADSFLQTTYPELYGKAKHMSQNPATSSRLWAGLAASQLGGEVITAPLPGAGRPNPYCANFKPRIKMMMAASRIRCRWKVIPSGSFGSRIWVTDLEQGIRHDVPDNRIGTFDLWVVSHHGQPMSNSEVLYMRSSHGCRLDNGTRKGATQRDEDYYSAPGLEDCGSFILVLSGQEYTVPGMFIVILLTTAGQHACGSDDPPQPGRGTATASAQRDGILVKVSAQMDGSSLSRTPGTVLARHTKPGPGEQLTREPP